MFFGGHRLTSQHCNICQFRRPSLTFYSSLLSLGRSTLGHGCNLARLRRSAQVPSYGLLQRPTSMERETLTSVSAAEYTKVAVKVPHQVLASAAYLNRCPASAGDPRTPE